jgi:hypothetical protein
MEQYSSDPCTELKNERAINPSKRTVGYSLFKNMEIERYRLFLHYFDTIPSALDFYGIHSKKARKWFKQNYKAQIFKEYEYKSFNHDKPGTIDNFYLLKNRIQLFFRVHGGQKSGLDLILYAIENKTEIERLTKSFKRFAVSKRPKNRISIIGSSSDGSLHLRKLKIKATSEDIDARYNDDFSIFE